MAIAFRAAASAVGNATAWTVTVPSTVVAGDLLIVIAAWTNSAAPTVTSPTGWTQFGTETSNPTITNTRILSKRAVTADIGAAVTFSSSALGKWELSLVAYSGATSIAQANINTESSANTTHTTTALTGMGATSWALVAWDEKSTTNTSWAAPGTATSRVNQLGTGSAGVSMLVADSNTNVSSFAAQTATAGISSRATNIALEIASSATVVAPGAPTSVAASAGDTTATVSFIPGSTGGATVSYTATSSPGSHTATGSSSPITVPGLTNGTAYTFTVTATNSAGSTTSASSIAVTPTSATQAFIGWGKPLNGGTPVTPVVSTLQVGEASPTTPTYQEGWDTTGGISGVTLLRTYNQALPTNWAASNATRVTGPTSWIASVKPSVLSTNSGSLDAAISTFAASVPNGTYLCGQHEPENKTKNILPADFGTFAVRFQSLVKAANPTLKVGVIFMTYTSNTRTPGSNAWLQAAADAGLNPDWVGFDGYPRVPNSAQTEFAGPTAIAQAAFPGVEMVVGEIGFLSSTIRTQQIADAFTYFRDTGLYTKMIYFDEVGTTGDYTLTNAERRILGGLR